MQNILLSSSVIRIITGFVVAISLAVSAIALARVAKKSKSLDLIPKLFLSKTTYELVDLIPGESREISVGLQNRGTKELNLISTRSSCGCTVARLQDRVILPGKISEMRVKISAPQVGGLFTSNLIIVSDDELLKEVVLTFTGVARWEVESSKMELPLESRDENLYEGEISLFSPYGKFLKTEFVSNENSVVQVDLILESHASQSYRVRYLGDYVSEFVDNLRFKTNSKLRPHIDIPVKLWKKNGELITPTLVNLGTVQANSIVKAKFNCTSGTSAWTISTFAIASYDQDQGIADEINSNSDLPSINLRDNALEIEFLAPIKLGFFLLQLELISSKKSLQRIKICGVSAKDVELNLVNEDR